MKTNFLKTIKNSIKYWWIHILTGVFFIITGIYTISSPAASYFALATIFSLTFLASGIMEVFYAISNREEIDGWGWVLVFGILTTMVGIMMLLNPMLSEISLPFYVGFVLMFRSFNAIGFAMELKNYNDNSFNGLLFMGVLGAILSFFMIFNPVFGGLTIVFWTGMGFIVLGAFSIYLATRLKKLKNHLDD